MRSRSFQKSDEFQNDCAKYNLFVDLARCAEAPEVPVGVCACVVQYQCGFAFRSFPPCFPVRAALYGGDLLRGIPQ